MWQSIASLGKFSLKYLYVGGASLLSMGLVMGLVSEQWWPLPALIVGLGSTLVTIWFYFWLQASGWSQANPRRLLLQTLALMMLLVAVNSVIVHFSWRLDLTENQLFTLSSQTQQLVKSLSQPLKVWIFGPYATAGHRELLVNYSKLSSQFRYEFASTQSPAAQKFQVQAPGEVHLEYGSKKLFLQSLQPGEFIQEALLTGGVEQIINPHQAQIYVLQGHGEPSLQGTAIKTLQAMNYRLKPLILANNPLPPDATLLAVMGAQKTLLAQEVQAIEHYLSHHGRVLLLVDPQTQIGLEPLLKKWGIELNPGLAIDQTSPEQLTSLDPRVPIVTDYGEHPITQDFGNGISFFPWARPLTLTAVPTVTAIPLLKTSAQSWAETQIHSEKLAFNAGVDQHGPLILGIAARQGQNRLVVIGSSQFIRDGIFEQQLNRDVFLNAVGWLSERSPSSLAVRPKLIANRRINLSVSQSQLLFWLPIVLLPGASLSIAGLLWWQRR